MARIAPGSQALTDVDRLLEPTSTRRKWARRLRRPEEVQRSAWLLLTPEFAVRATHTSKGWRIAEDPTDVYAQDTPEHALRALVLASRAQRWDVLLRLAPRRYRQGLAVSDLERAWTTGDHARALAQARDRLASGLGGPVAADDHEAQLDLGDGLVARLEREGDRWVVVDF